MFAGLEECWCGEGEGGTEVKESLLHQGQQYSHGVTNWS